MRNCGRIDFILCENNGGWYITSKEVPLSVAAGDNAGLQAWMEEELKKDGEIEDICYIGVYWRDPAVDEVSQDSLLN
jgi:hypothetical protein